MDNFYLANEIFGGGILNTNTEPVLNNLIGIENETEQTKESFLDFTKEPTAGIIVGSLIVAGFKLGRLSNIFPIIILILVSLGTYKIIGGEYVIPYFIILSSVWLIDSSNYIILIIAGILSLINIIVSTSGILNENSNWISIIISFVSFCLLVLAFLRTNKMNNTYLKNIANRQVTTRTAHFS